MTGDLNRGVNKITSSAVLSEDIDLVNKKYLDEHLACRLNDDDTRIIMNNMSLKANRSGEAKRSLDS